MAKINERIQEIEKKESALNFEKSILQALDRSGFDREYERLFIHIGSTNKCKIELTCNEWVDAVSLYEKFKKESLEYVGFTSGHYHIGIPDKSIIGQKKKEISNFYFSTSYTKFAINFNFYTRLNLQPKQLDLIHFVVTIPQAVFDQLNAEGREESYEKQLGMSYFWKAGQDLTDLL